jgi:hypothetical protein
MGPFMLDKGAGASDRAKLRERPLWRYDNYEINSSRTDHAAMHTVSAFGRLKA